MQVQSSDVAKSFGKYAMEAQHQVVEVTAYNRPHVVMLSPREYERLRRLDRQVHATSELSADLISAIAEAKPTAEANQFNDEAE